jgi:hypothetical protein
MTTPFLLLALWLPCAAADAEKSDDRATLTPAAERLDYLEAATQLFTPICQALCQEVEPECEARCLAGVVSPEVLELQAQRQVCALAGGVWRARMPACATSLQAGLDLTGDSRVSEVMAVIQTIYARCSAEALCQDAFEENTEG